jgi:aldehyde dehydrogenase (NAD+)
VINVVMGTGERAGAPLATPPGVRLVSFTGSTETGRLVATQAARHDKICSLEMGGKNVIMVMEDADLDLAVEGTIWGAFGTTGQRCTAASRIVVHHARSTDQFIGEADRSKARELRIGNGLKSERRCRAGDQSGGAGEDPRLH